MKNYYDVLELDKNCTAKEVKDSYIKLSKKYHPDKNKSNEAQKKIVEINEAYAVLKNESTRYRYDENLERKTRQQQYQSNYNRPKSYEEYVHYYQNINLKRPENFYAGKFTLVICCCMLMVFGAGLRIMYAWSQAYHRKTLSEEAARNFLEPVESSDNSKLDKIQRIWKKKRERELKNKKDSES